MLGQGSGLNNSLRKLLARIQREFQFPRVISVKCHIHAGSHTWRDRTPVQLNRVAAPQISLNQPPLGLESAVVRGTIDSSSCRRMETMEEISTRAHQIICWQKENLIMHRPEAGVRAPRCGPFPIRIAMPLLQRPFFKIPGFKMHRMATRLKAVVRKNTELAQTFPMLFTIQPLNSLPMKMQIRFRTSVLTSLGLKPTQVRFCGVVRDLPPIPLRLLDVEKGLHSELALGRIVGEPNAMLGRRVWVIVYHLEKGRFIPITLKEE